jgi:hypothetical protein
LPGLRRTRWQGAASARGLRQLVANLRQHAGPDKLGVNLIVEGFEARHHVAVEQLVDDQLDLHVKFELAHRISKRLAERRRADRVAGVLDRGATDDHAEPLIDQMQSAREAVFRLRHHARYGQRIFEFLVVDQRKPAAALIGHLRPHRFEVAFGEIAEDLRKLFLEHAFDELALLADFAHAVEELHLHGVALGALGEMKQRIVDVLE